MKMNPTNANTRRLARLAAALATSAALCCLATARAQAASQITSFSAATTTQVAGAHPDFSMTLGVATTDYPATPGNPANPAPDEYLQQVVVNLPPGLLANATSFPTCPESLLTETGGVLECPAGSELGVFVANFAAPDNSTTYNTRDEPIINEAPLPGEAARLAIPIGGGIADLHVDLTVRDQSDYGAVATVSGIASIFPIDSFSLDLWGVPSAPSHDGQRLGCYDGYSSFAANCSIPGSGSQTFLVNPTSCQSPSSPVDVSANFYGDPTTYTASADLGATTGCQGLPFDPALSLSDTSGLAGQPDAYTANLTVPQDNPSDDSGATTAALHGVSVQLPAGVALSPSVANGLSACSDAQFNFGAHADNTCPASSQIGTVTVDTPLLTAPLTGQLFVGQQESSDPTSGEMYRLLLAADGGGVHLKLIGNVSADPATGRLTVTFPDDPQVPFSSLQLQLDGGPLAPLVNPYDCGTATSNWSMTSYANPGVPVTGSSSFDVSGDCSLSSQFTPSLATGTQSNRAGASSPFSFTLTRPDGQEWMSRVASVTLPTGLNADIASATQCSGSDAAAGTCPASSQVGTATVAAGPGSEPYYLQGQPVYLTGPYEGAPFGLAVVVHALAGPFDLGTVVVRQAISVNPNNAQVTIRSDSLPTMLGGVPLDLQSISLDIDRPGFMRSPTSCAAKSIQAYVQGSTPGQPAIVDAGYEGFAPVIASTVRLTEPYQAGDCAALKFSPTLSLEASGKGQTRTNDHPTLTAKLTQPANQANLSSVQVALPLSLALDPNNSEHVCSVKDAARIACPKGTIVGTATAVTRILPHPLSGDVYLVQGERKGPHGTILRTLPTLLVPLHGRDGVSIDLRAQTSVNGAEQLVTTFRGIPDAGVRSFDLTINGGRRGILVVTGGQNLCRGDETASVTENAQNGRAYYESPTLDRPACRVSHASKKHT